MADREEPEWLPVTGHGEVAAMTPANGEQLMPRPPMTLAPAQIDQVEGLASVLSQEQMADYFGMARNTFAAIMERQPEVRALYKKGRAKAIGAVAQGLLQRARGGDTASAISRPRPTGARPS